jgi:hypothetical protein
VKAREHFAQLAMRLRGRKWTGYDGHRVSISDFAIFSGTEGGPMEATAAATEEPAPFPAHPADHRFFNTMSILSALVIVTGFASKYFPHISTVPTIIHVHAAVFAGWLAITILQTTLVRVGNPRLHRTLGPFFVLYAAAMCVVGIETALASARGGHKGIPGVEFPDVAGFLLLNVNAVLVFAVLIALAWSARRKPQTHKRIMLLAMFSLLGPGVARLPLVAGHPPAVIGLALGFLLSGPIYDWVTRRRVHRAWAWALFTFVGAPPVVMALSSTAAWHNIAGWLIG